MAAGIKTPPPPLAGGGWGEGAHHPGLRSPAKNLQYARVLRHDSTLAERRLWRALRSHRLGGLKFRRQAPLGPFIADFYCATAALVIELDGVSHIDTADADARRDEWMRARGLHVLRFTNGDVLGDVEAVITVISEFVRSTPPPIPLPQGEGEESSIPAPRPLAHV
jgi:very-short-patch-repair endonuclease